MCTNKFYLSFLIIASIFILLLSACQPLPTDNASHRLESTEDIIVEDLTTSSPHLNKSDFEKYIPKSTPLVFTFPTPESEPISLWRPPLYEIPWALSPQDHFFFSRPILADEINWPSADYRYGGIFFGPDVVHTGIDIPSKKGTTVVAAAAGEVISVGYGLYLGGNNPNDPYGLAVTIRHDFGYKGKQLYTVYAHLDRIDVEVGQWVEVGTPIGIVGTTGFTTGAHLHFEVRIDSNSFFSTRNPELWLAPPQGWGVLVGRVMNKNGSLQTKKDVTVRSKSNNQKWTVITYGKHTVNSDEFLNENLVLSDLPSGEYELIIDYLEVRYISNIEIHPGAITYFSYRGEDGFDLSPPPTPVPFNW